MHAIVSSRSYVAFAAVWAALLLIPFAAPNNYVVSLANLFLINVILIASLNLLMGYAGQISLSHAAFYGLGAYVSGVLSTKFGWPPLAGLAAAIAVTACLAFLIGFPALRLRGHYLAMATLGFNAIVSVVFVEWRSMTGGPNGLINVPSLDLFGYRLTTDTRLFYFSWVVAGVVFLLILNLLDSRVGRALRALSSSEVAAASVGVDVQRYKIQLFVLTAVMAAVAGFLYVHSINFASPETFDFMASVMLVIMVALGGTGSVWGPLFGALLYSALPELLRTFEDFEILLFGVSLIVVLLFLPGGIAGALGILVERIRRLRGDRPTAQRPVLSKAPESLS